MKQSRWVFFFLYRFTAFLSFFFSRFPCLQILHDLFIQITDTPWHAMCPLKGGHFPKWLQLRVGLSFCSFCLCTSASHVSDRCFLSVWSH